LFKAHPHLQRLDQVSPGSRADVTALAARGGATDKAPFVAAVEDFYLTNVIARSSPIMAKCSALAESHGALRAAE
jgi:NADH-quinone oxidoreductase subunit G